VGWFSWRAAFLVNIPVAGATLAMAVFWIAKDPDPVRGRSARETIGRIDPAGVVAFGATMTALLVFLLSLPDPDWTALGGAVAMAVVMVWWSYGPATRSSMYACWSPTSR